MIKNCIFPPRTISLFLFALILTLRISPAWAQGGPPLLTDDSDTPGDGKWENNFAIAFEGSKSDYLLAFPFLDLNYGLGEHFQLKCELSWVKENGDALANKFDGITLGAKYRVLDEDSDGVSFSVYPQPIISFNPEDRSNSVAIGIILPIAISKQILTTGVNVQVGYQILGSTSQWIYGLVLDHELGKSFLLLGEIHGTFRRITTNGSGADDVIFLKDGTFVNLGLQIKPSKSYFINFAIGKDFESPPFTSGDAKYYGYLGLQLNL